ncbi:tyrosine-type recombinase/integrase [Sinorhizobium medicae]|nr:tyrosine-type recombinase/integrase [Sinorhizobium medicae]
MSADAAALIQRQPHRIGYVFSRKKGAHPIEYNAILWGLADVCKAAGIDKITPHTLRRTLATHSAIDGANVAELMQFSVGLRLRWRCGTSRNPSPWQGAVPSAARPSSTSSRSRQRI